MEYSTDGRIGLQHVLDDAYDLSRLDNTSIKRSLENSLYKIIELNCYSDTNSHSRDEAIVDLSGLLWRYADLREEPAVILARNFVEISGEPRRHGREKIVNLFFEYCLRSAMMTAELEPLQRELPELEKNFKELEAEEGSLIKKINNYAKSLKPSKKWDNKWVELEKRRKRLTYQRFNVFTKIEYHKSAISFIQNKWIEENVKKRKEKESQYSGKIEELKSILRRLREEEKIAALSSSQMNEKAGLVSKLIRDVESLKLKLTNLENRPYVSLGIYTEESPPDRKSLPTNPWAGFKDI